MLCNYEEYCIEIYVCLNITPGCLLYDVRGFQQLQQMMPLAKKKEYICEMC